MKTQMGRHGKETTMITFCLPARQLKPASKEGKYGMWFDNPLPKGEHPELWEVYNNIVLKYDSKTGKPVKMARDDQSRYPVFIPPQYILGVSRQTGA